MAFALASSLLGPTPNIAPPAPPVHVHLPHCTPDTRNGRLLKEIRDFRLYDARGDPADRDARILFIGPPGAGKSSLIKSLLFLAANNMELDWPADPRVAPYSPGAGAHGMAGVMPQGSYTRGMHIHQMGKSAVPNWISMTDLDGVEGVAAAECFMLKRLVEGRVTPRSKMNWQPGFFERAAIGAMEYFSSPPMDRPDAIVLCISLHVNMDFGSYRKIIEKLREMEIMPTVVVIGMREYVEQFAPGARPARCPGKERGHTVCSNRANICWENFIRQSIGFPDIYLCEPCRAGPEYQKADFEHFGAENIEEMLTMLRDTTQSAQARYRRTTF